MRQKAKGFKHFKEAFFYSLNGVKACFKNEAGFRHECGACLLLVPLSFFVGENGAEIAILLFSVFFVLIIEILNSAVEAAIDRISLEHHKLSGLAKDLGSAAVFMAMLLCLLTWIVVFLF
ncbi:MAG: diacylglycerol kinase [Pasteurellales bacterium]|nr:MAG: diacylglycerol kinase [Pasteurellales bacterium]